LGGTERALEGFDAAWARYEQELADYDPRGAIGEALEKIDELLARFLGSGKV